MLSHALRWLLVAACLFAVAGGADARQNGVLLPGAQRAPELPIVDSIEVVGNRRYKPEALLGALGQSVGERVDERAISEGIKRLFDVYRVLGVVSFQDVEGADDRIRLKLTIEELAVDLEPRFRGNDEVAEAELMRWARLSTDGELYLYQGPRVRDRILEGYRREGYAFAEVSLVERPGGIDPDTQAYVPPDVIFDIVEGPRVKVWDVEVHGAKSMPDGGWGLFRYGLLKLAGAELRDPRFFGLFKSTYDRDVLEEDLVAMRTVYRERGYLNAVVELQELEFNDERDRVTIHIAVDEGPLYRVRNLEIQGVEWIPDESLLNRGEYVPTELYFPADELLELCKLGPGAVFDRPSQLEDQRAIGSFYGSRGYIDHPTMPEADRYRFLSPQVLFSDDPSDPVVDVIYRVAQGSKQRIGEILVSGNHYTRDRVIRDRIDLDPGDVADLDVIRRARARIEGTGFFTDPFNVIDHRPPEFRFLPTDDPEVKDLEFLVEEGTGLNFGINGGITSTGGAFGSINVTKENFDISRLPSSFGNLFGEVASLKAFHGAGQTLRLQAAPGTRFSTYELMFFEPDLFRLHRKAISLRVSARRRFRAFSSHDEERDEVSIRWGLQLGPDSSVFWGFNYASVDVSDLSSGGEPSLSNPLSVPAFLKDQEGRNNLSHLLIGYRYNTVDNRINPKNGVNFGANSKFFLDALGADYEFIQTDLTFDYYDEFGLEDGQAASRWHFGARLGVGLPLNDSEFVPYTERYYLGGRIMRGFNFRGIGPFEQGEPVGGETFAYTTFEYRAPLVTTTQPQTYREIETLHGGFFVDLGILDPDELSLDAPLRASAGILFGISVPLPITFSFGWPILDEPGDEFQVLDFSIGTR